MNYSKQTIDELDEAIIVSTLNSDYLASGPKSAEFERDLVEYTGAAHCAVCNSATSGLRAAIEGLKPFFVNGPGVWVPVITFVATAAVVLEADLDLELLDVEARTGNIDILALERKLASVIASGNQLPSAIIVVHMGGNPVDMESLSEICQPLGIRLIEDASHALSARYSGGGRVGSCEYSDATVFSFHPVKPITTGEGGCIMVNHDEVFRRIQKFVSHCVERSTYPTEPWRYDVIGNGRNYRLDELSAALGISQLRKLDGFRKSREEISSAYDKQFSDISHVGEFQHIQESAQSAFHLKIFLFSGDIVESANKRLIAYRKLVEMGIKVQVHYLPISELSYYKGLGYSTADYCGGLKYYSSCLSLPMYPFMDESVIAKIYESFVKLF